MGQPFDDHDDALLEPTTGVGEPQAQPSAAAPTGFPRPESKAEGLEVPVGGSADGTETPGPQPVVSSGDAEAPITSAQLDQLTAKAESLSFNLKTVSAESRKRGFNKLAELTQSQWKELMDWLEVEGK